MNQKHLFSTDCELTRYVNYIEKTVSKAGVPLDRPLLQIGVLAVPIVTVTALIVMVLTAGLAGAQERADFFEGKEEGWFWYEDPIIPEEQEPERPPETTSASGKQSTEQGLAPMSVEWLQKQLPILRNRAIDEPTFHNVSAYKYAERIMMDKAQLYSDMSRAVVEQDPLLDENLRVPFASAAKTAMMSAMDDARNELLADLSKVVGVWVFYNQDCSFCQAQVAPINSFVSEHGFDTTIITKDGNFLENVSPAITVRTQTGQFQTLGIEFTPAIVMLSPPNDFFVVSQGFVSKKALEDRILSAAHRYGLLTDEDYNRVVPTREGLLAANSFDEEEIDWNNSHDWMPFLREQLQSAYGIVQDGDYR